MASITITGTTDTSDTYLDFGSPNTNTDTSDQANLIIGALFGGGNKYRGLLKFDLTEIPSGATIDSAVLTLFTGTDFSNRTGTIKVYRSLRAWVENQATWNIYSTGNSWGTAGAANTTTDREASEIGSASTPGSTAADTQIDISLTKELLQEMVSGAFTNNGFVLKSDSETDADGHIYRSSEYAVDTTKRPKLVVNYTEGGAFMAFF